MADSNVKMKVVAENQASATLQKIKQDLAGLDKQASTAAGGLGAFGKALGVAGLVAFGTKAAQVTAELANLGNQSIAMRASFEQMAGGAENATTILEALTQASRGTVTQYDLMLASNRAMLLGVADSAEEFSQLMQIAAARGRAMGLSTTQAFNDIVTGLGRMSPLILDNLGIVVDQQKAQEAYAVTLGKTAAELTDAEKKQALVNDVIANSADLLRDANSNAKVYAGEGMAQLQTAWSEFRTTLGESLGPFLDARAKEIADFVNNASESLGSLSDAEAFRAQFAEVAPAISAALAGITDPAQQKAIAQNLGEGILTGDLDSLQKQVEEYNRVIGEFQDAARRGDGEGLNAANNQLGVLAVSIDAIAREYNILAGLLGQPLIDTALLASGILDFQKLEETITDTADAAANTAPAVDTFAQSFADALAILEGAEGKLDGLYDTLLDTGNIEGAAAAYGQIRGVLQEIVAEWVRQGIKQEEITNNLLPKLISELDGVIAAQVEAGQAGVDSGALIGSGFLSAIPGIQAVIGIVNQLTGAVVAAGEGIRAVQRQAGASLSQFSPGRGTRGAGDAFANGLAPSLGRAPTADRSFGGLGGELSRRNAGIGGRSIVGGVGASFGVGGSGGGGGSIDNEAQKLANRLTSILNGALKSGINLDEILGRQDAIEEPARRLADIAVRGFESPWVDYVKNTFPEIWKEIESAGDPKAAAASILRDFEDGLRPELLDKNRAKELVKRALLGEQNTAALAAEIAGELASELGVSLEQAQSAAAGVLGTGSTGTGDGTGLDGGVAATAFTDSFVGAMAGFLTRYQSTGESAGAAFQVGFLATTASMPTAILQNLAGLLLPMLAAALAGQNSRTGAS